MTTSPSTGLSPEAKEFVPFIPVPASTTMAPIYPPNPQPLIYPLMKFPEIDFHLQTSQPFHTDANQSLPMPTYDSTSQIMLLPAAGCYPNTPLLYSSHGQPPAYFPSGYNDSSLLNYPPAQPNSHRISLYPSHRSPKSASYRSDNQQSKLTSTSNRQNAQPTPNKHSSRGHRARPVPQHEQTRETFNSTHYQNGHPDHDDGTLFQLRSEDFPSLPMGNQPSEKVLTQPSTNTSTRPTASWNKVVSAPRPQSTSPHSVSSRDQESEQKRPSKNSNKSPTPSKSKASPRANQPRSHSLTREEKQVKEPSQKNTDEFAQTKQQQKRVKQQKAKLKEEPVTVQKEEPSSLPAESPFIPFALDDESAFPVLGQELSLPAAKTSDNPASTKETSSTPGLISKAKVKASHSYQIRLQDMFNALSTAVQTKQQTAPHKPVTVLASGANPLDSNPAPKRGKEREQPKPRKPTKLKRIINRELEENQKQRQQLFAKVATMKQSEDNDTPNETNTDDRTHDPSASKSECTSASCTEDSNNDSEEGEDEDDDDDDDEILDHEPTSQLQTPFAHQVPPSNIKQQIHDAGFREYCAQLIDRQLDELCIQLLLTLKRFQDRKKQQFQANPERARRKRRFVHGIREVTKHLRLQRLKCVLIAPDCQSIQSEGGLNDAIDSIINLCKEQNIPYVFTLNRQKLGRCLNKIARISAIGIFDYSGADQVYKQIIEITNENQRAYKQIIDNIVNHEDATSATPSHGLNSREFYKILHRTFQQQNQQRQHIVNTIPGESLSKVLPKVPAHYAHSRQTSDTSTIYIDPQLINSIKQQHTRASSGTFDMGKTATTKKNHQRTLSDGATTIDDALIPVRHHVKTHSRTPSGCSAISQIEQQDYFEQSRSILMNNNDEPTAENEENRLKSIHEDTEESSANIKRKNVEKWINDN